MCNWNWLFYLFIRKGDKKERGVVDYSEELGLFVKIFVF